jgi:hypothetical protein
MSTPDISCWDNIIGLSRTECDCYDAITAISNSGLYLDELIQLRSVNELLNCEEGSDLWDKMDKARENAIRLFIGELNLELLKHFKLKREPFYGNIGRIKATGTAAVTNGYYYGIRVYCCDVVGGVFKIKKIGTLFNKTGAVTVFVYNNMNELLGTYSLNTVANVHTVNDIVDLELPMHDGIIDNLEYYIIYQYTTAGAYVPLNNEIKCACGKFRAVFDTSKPYWFGTQSDKQYYWTHYAMAGGFLKSDIVDLSDLSSTTSNFTYGLTLECEFKCKIQQTLCEDYFDFEANPLAIATAIAIRYKAGELLINDILTTPNINRNVMINREHLLAMKDEIMGKYRENLNYIAQNINVRSTDCYECRDIIDMTTKGIFA